MVRLAPMLVLAVLVLPVAAHAEDEETPFGGQPVVYSHDPKSTRSRLATRQLDMPAPVVKWDDSDNRPTRNAASNSGRGNRGSRR